MLNNLSKFAIYLCCFDQLYINNDCNNSVNHTIKKNTKPYGHWKLNFYFYFHLYLYFPENYGKVKTLNHKIRILDSYSGRK